MPAAERLGLTWWWLTHEYHGRNASSGCTMTWPDGLVLERTHGTNATLDAQLGAGQPLGIAVGSVLAGAMLIALGTNLIRRGARYERHRRAPHQQRAYPRQPSWWFGALLLLVGHIGTFVAFFFTAGWLVWLLSLTALLWNVLFAHIVNRERASGRVICAVVLIVCGLGAFIVFGSPAPPILIDQDALREKWEAALGQPFWITLLAVTGVSTAILLGCDLALLCSHERAVEVAISKGDAEEGTSRVEVSLDTALKALSKSERKALRLLYPLGSALLAGWHAILLQSLSHMLRAHLTQPGDCSVGIMV